ncbi:MAG: molybdopterin cofactor-binding domain-containing protein [Actinomycetes bacterium]
MALPRGLAANARLSRWLSIASDGSITVRVGKVELGQGVLTALAQIAADELDVDLARVRMAPANTASSPDEGVTAGSMSVSDSGAALASACAHVRALFVREAAARLDIEEDAVVVADGVFGDAQGGRRTSYGSLAAAIDLDRDADGTSEPKASDGMRVVGTSVPRLDLPDKIAGMPRFIHDLVLPGQVYGRVVRPPSPAATLVDVDTGQAEARAGVLAVVRDGSFLGVVAESEYIADRAATLLSEGARWKEEATLPDEDDLPGFLRAAPTDTLVVEDTGDADTPQVDTRQAGTPGRVVREMSAAYSRPFLAHASMAPSCGAARWDEGSLTVWTHSQGIHPLRGAIAQALGLDATTVTVQHVDGAGSYGHNGADDAAFDAVLLARATPGRPVHVRWSRQDELTWAPFGSAMSVQVHAGLDTAGNVHTWSFDVWSQGHVARPGYDGSPRLLAAAHLERPQPLAPAVDPPLTRGGGTARNAAPIYAFPARRVVAHRVLQSALRSSALRALGAFTNVFAIESFMDELALSAGRDPVEYRLAHLDDSRACAVLEAAAQHAGWRSDATAPDTRETPGTPGDSVGRGVAVARYKGRGGYCAVVAEVEAVHEVRLRRLVLVADVGRVVNPDGLRNQIEGGAVQASSWTLKERVRFDRERVTSVDWETYPILPFSEIPQVDVHVLDHPGEPSLGAGEIAQGPTAAAIGNALADALGVRVRDLPLSAENIVAAMET